MGKVYLAEQSSLERLVCLKTLQPELAANPTVAARFEREARTTGRLRHPNIVEILDFGRTDDGTHFLVMEYVEGESLRDLLDRDAPLPWQRAATILEQILSALEEAHGAKVLHRDLKPENVLVGSLRDGSLRVKVVDFGIAKLVDEGGDQRLTRTGMVCGTPGYMAPEQILGETLDGRADVYAAGVILYEMLTGRRPLPASTVQESMRRHLEDVPPSPSTLSALPLPPALDRLVLSALEKRKERRFASAVEFKHALQTLQRHSSTSLSTPTQVIAPALSADACSCPACGAQESRDRRFCGQCGAALQPGTEAPASARTPTSSSTLDPDTLSATRQLLPEALAAHLEALPAALQGEKRNVTVLFADLSGFTAMSETMDPEEVRAVMNRCFDGMVEAVHRYDGMVDKFIGDCIMVVFGAPKAHEDDPERALRCALDMLAYMEEVNKTLPRKLGFRIGVNAGEVVAGGVGGQRRMDYTVIGDVVNLAQRLESAARVGTILCSASVERLTRRMARFKALPPIKVKGKKKPVEVFELASLIGAEDETGIVFVGRSVEMRELRRALGEAREGRGGRRLVIGGAGMGKSRLLSELQAIAHSEGFTVVRTAPERFSDPSPLHLVRRIVSALIDAFGAEPERERSLAERLSRRGLSKGAAAVIEGFLSEREQTSSFDPREEARHLRAAILDLFAQTPGAGLALLLDDLHRADATSLTFLASLEDQLSNKPCAIVATTRPGEVSHLLPGAPQITLSPLTDSEILEVARAELDGQHLPLEVADTLAQRAEGNPLFAREIVRSLIDQEFITLSGGTWTTQPGLHAATLPDNLVLLLSARIDRLSPISRRVLRVGAVFGSTFGLEIVRAVLDDAVGVEAATEEAVHRGFLEASVRPPGGYVFTSESLRDAILGGMVRTDRQGLHARIAEAIEGGAHWGEAHPAELAAKHFFLAGQIRKGIRYATRAGDRLWERGQAEAASALYRKAIEATLDELHDLPRLGDAGARSILRLAARTTTALGLIDPSAGLDISRRCLDAINEHLAPAARAELLLSRARLFSALGRLNEVETTVQAGLALLDRAPDPVTRAHLLSEAGGAREIRGDIAGATTQALESLRLVTGGRDGASELLWRVLNQLGRLHLRAGEPQKAIEFFENALTQARQHRERLGEARTLSNLAGAIATAGDHARAESLFREALSLAETLGDRVGIARVHFNLGRLLATRADGRQEARAHLIRAREEARRVGWREGIAAVVQVLAGLPA